MANTRAQQQIAKWTREHWLPTQLGIQFDQRPVALSTGGQYRFDAVSRDKYGFCCDEFIYDRMSD